MSIEALKLADEQADDHWIVGTKQWCGEAAAELRRLHEENERLQACLFQMQEAAKQLVEKQEPYGCVTVVKREGCVDQHWFYRHPEPPYLDNAAECHTVYTTPPAAQPVFKPCSCRWDGETQVQQCTLHAAHIEAIHEWAERAKAAESKLKGRTNEQEA